MIFLSELSLKFLQIVTMTPTAYTIEITIIRKVNLDRLELSAV